MAVKADYIARLREVYPEFWASLGAPGREQLQQWAINHAQSGLSITHYMNKVRATGKFTSWQIGQVEPPPPPDEPPPPPDEPPPPPPPDPNALDPAQMDVRDILIGFLRDNELPESLLGFITDALVNDMSYNEIIARLRETPEYLAAYPENDIRRQNGFEWWPEAQVRQYRSEVRRLADQYFGEQVGTEEIASLIGGNVSLSEIEGRMQDWKQFERYGPVVRGVLESELGFTISDERLFAFISRDIATPELDRAYETALMRGQPAALGLGIRPEEEADLLRQYGIDVAKAFAGYQGVASELPRTERMKMIEAEINRNAGSFPEPADLLRESTIGELVKAVQFGDVDSIRRLQGMMSREIARFQATGGVAFTGTAGVGLLSAAERRQEA